MVVEITPPMISNITYKSYIVFAACNFAAIPMVYFCYPETSCRPLEVIDLLFADRDGKRPSIFQVVKDSKNKEFVKKIEQQLQDRAELRDANELIANDVKEDLEHLEMSKIV